jgi:hypothetical protein
MGTLAIHMGLKIVNVVFLYNTHAVSSHRFKLRHHIPFKRGPWTRQTPGRLIKERDLIKHIINAQVGSSLLLAPLIES